MDTTSRSNNWSVTINNPTEADHEEIARARQKGWKVMGQEEVGAEGTPHLQLLVQTPQVRFSAIKKAFSRAHIEIARNVQALAAYVLKDDTRVAALPTSQQMYPSLSKFWQLVFLNVKHNNWVHWQGDRWYVDAFRDLGFSEVDYERYERDGKCRCEVNEVIAKRIFESCVDHLIGEGYHVEHFFSPPNISVFKKFHFSLLIRAETEINAQTSRQTDNASEGEEEHVDE